MSADNGIYILHTEDGYRVAHLQAIENLFWNKGKVENTPQNNALIRMFGDKEPFDNKAAALLKAKELEESYYFTEYGIQFLEFPNIKFPKEKIKEPEEDIWFEQNIKIETLRKKNKEGYYDKVAYLVTINRDDRTISFRVGLNEDLFQEIKEYIYV